MKVLKIKITGSGTREEIVKALQDVITSMVDSDDDATFEDATLYTELSEDDDEGE